MLPSTPRQSPARRHLVTSLTLYHTSVHAGTPSTAHTLATGTGGTQQTGSASRPSIGYLWVELQGPSGVATTTQVTPTGAGFLLENPLLEGQRIPAGNFVVTLSLFHGGTVVWNGRLYARVYKRSSAGVYTLIASGNEGADYNTTASATPH